MTAGCGTQVGNYWSGFLPQTLPKTLASPVSACCLFEITQVRTVHVSGNHHLIVPILNQRSALSGSSHAL